MGSVLRGSGAVSLGRCEPRARGTSLPPFHFLNPLERRSYVCTRGVTLHVPLAPQLLALHARSFNPGSASAAPAVAVVPPVPSAESLGEEVGEEGEGEKSGAADPIVDALLQLAGRSIPVAASTLHGLPTLRRSGNHEVQSVSRRTLLQ